MSRMFHRVLATSVIGAAAFAAPAAAMAAADTGGGSGGAATPTAVVVHLPKHVQAGEPVTVTARITPQPAAQDQGGEHAGKGQDGKDKTGQGGDQQGKTGKGKGKKGTGHRHHKGTGHGTGKGKTKGKGHKGGKGRRHAVTGKVAFFLDGRPEPPVAVSRDQASEKIEIPLGRHTIVAEYSGDGDFLAAKSAPVTFELTDGQDDQGAQNGQDQDGRVGPGAQAGQDDQDDSSVGLDDPSIGQDDPSIGQDQGDQDQIDDQGQGTENQNGQEDQI